jgi:hypothetical protein
MKNMQTNIDYNDTQALLETGDYDLDCKLKNEYVNYLKILMYKKANLENYVRPCTNITLEGYSGYTTNIEDVLKLKKGDYYIMIYPDVITTPEIDSFYPNSASIGYAYIYDKNNESVKMVFRKSIDFDNIELYRCISSFISFDKEIRTKSAFVRAPFLPLITDQVQGKGDIRMIDFFKDISNKNISFKEINKTKDLRFVTPLNSLDVVGKVDNQPIIFIDPMKEGSKITEVTNIFTDQNESDIVEKYGLTPRLFKFLLNAVETSKIKKYAVMPVLSCLLLDISVNDDLNITTTTKLELFSYDYLMKNNIVVQDSQTKLINDCVKIMKIGYFMSPEELVRLLIIKNNYTMNIIEEKDRQFIRSIKNDENRRNSILGVLNALWQYYKEETKIN